MRMVKTVSVSFWSLNVRNEKAFNNNLLQMAAIAESTFAYLATETSVIFFT
jgi:hypothetical protein